jgi:hypothetical protein
VTRRLHRGKTGLDPFASHQNLSGRAKANHATAAWPEHHLRLIYRGFPFAFAGKEGAVDCDRRRIGAAG